MPRLLCVTDDRPRLRLLTWALIEEGFEVEQCSPDLAMMRTRADPPLAVVVNCGTLDNDALAELVVQMLGVGENTRVIILGDQEAEGERVRYVPAPYRVADVVREIAEGSADAQSTTV